MRVNSWIAGDYVRYSFGKALYLLLLLFALILPWRMRIRYSEFLLLYGRRIKTGFLYQPYYAHLSRATEYFKQDKFDSALRELKKAEILDRQDGNVNLFIASCYAKLGKQEEYVSEIIKGVAKNKEFSKKPWESRELSQPEIDSSGGNVVN